MQKLVQIIYISRSTFDSTDTVNKIEPNVVRILAKSRINNRKNGLVDVLYFGDGAFLQCLEGDENAIDTLFAKIENDPRHKDVKLISRKYISMLSFPDWAMKYAPQDDRMRQYMKEHGYKSFDPYALTPQMTQNILGLLMIAHDPTAEAESNQAMLSQSSSVPCRCKHISILSMLLSLFACGLSAFSLLYTHGWI